MTFSGWIIVVTLALVAAYIMPALISVKQHSVDNPVEDRFSDGLTVLDVTRACPRVYGESTRSQPLLLPHSKIDVFTGERSQEMERTKTISPTGRRGTKALSTQKQLAKVVSARKVRLATEATAGKRRFLSVAISLTLLVAFGITAFTGTFSAAWLALPASTLVMTLVAGRIAYQKSYAAFAAEEAAIQKIHEKAESLKRERAAARARSEQIVTGSITLAGQQIDLPAEVAVPTLEKAETVLSKQAELEISEAEANHRAVQDAVVGTRAKGVSAKPTVPSAAAQDMIDSLAVPGLVHKSSVVRRRNAPRTVATDTGMMPTVGTPKRPVVARNMPVNARSSAEVANEAAQEALNLEQILDVRRAQ
ncbi:hypothetical protein NXS08_05695 [Gleimia sp. 6138-11-ORH1]|uniref:hypothetical protein n=1 Tax=Gleimia sp. 6138-11-ORH1 TaxID=2973937 RepID=UPI0021688993|nr:hypothetical protein [Gleimia sp. 6138-11-ORH1]MCS4484961.1 hypothetical protein [Gleimia sp. 6138-11-ORH1]